MQVPQVVGCARFVFNQAVAGLLTQWKRDPQQPGTWLELGAVSRGVGHWSRRSYGLAQKVARGTMPVLLFCAYRPNWTSPERVDMGQEER